MMFLLAKPAGWCEPKHISKMNDATKDNITNKIIHKNSFFKSSDIIQKKKKDEQQRTFSNN